MMCRSFLLRAALFTSFFADFCTAGISFSTFYPVVRTSRGLDNGSIKRSASSAVRGSHPSHSASPLVGLRGGGCEDSTPALFAKIAVSAVAETALMTLFLRGGKWLATRMKLPKAVWGVSLAEFFAAGCVIFASSAFGFVADGGLSAASQQVLSPNELPGDPDWYTNLKKPWWNPPGWLFPIMWLLVSKPTQLKAVTTVLQADPIPWKLLTIYTAHLSLGDAWNKVFFGLQCTGRGAAVISTFYGVLLSTAYLFSTVDKAAGLYMLPTCGWVTVATALNWNIYLNNK